MDNQVSQGGSLFLSGVNSPAILDSWSSARGMNSVEMYRKSGDVDHTAAVLRAIRDKAPGMPLYIPADINVALTGADGLTTEDLILTGPGNLVYGVGKEAISIERPMETAVSVTAIDLTTQNHVLNLAATTVDDFGDRLIKIQPTSVATFKANDHIALFSNDVVPMSEQVWGVGYKIYNKQLFRVKQIGIAYTAGTAFIEGQTVTGANGGSAVVRSATGTTTGYVFFDIISGTPFVNNEILSVGGSPKATMSGTPFLAVKGKLYYSFLTTPVIRKMSSAKFMLLGNLGIKTATDQNALIGAANRKAAIAVFGQSNPVFDMTFRSMYSKGLQLTSCFEGTGIIRAISGANNANTGSNGTPNEQAYSYPLEIMGASVGGHWQIYARNVRHGVSSNTWQMNAYATSDLNIHKMGFPIQHTITGKVMDTWSAGFDLHECAFDNRFVNCEVYNPGNGHRNITQSVGLQNRGNGTEIINLRVDNAVIGILDASRTQTTGFAYQNRIEGGFLTNIGLRGISDVATPTDGLGRLLIKDMTIEADNLWTNSPWNGNQAGIYFSNVAEVDIENVTTRKMRGSHWWFANGGNVRHANCHFDHSFVPIVSGNSDNNSHNIRLDNASINITGTIRSRVTQGTQAGSGIQQPTGFYRYNNAAGTPVFKVAEEPLVIGRTAAGKLPLVFNSLAGIATGLVDHGLGTYADDTAAKAAGLVMGSKYLKAGVETRVTT